MSSKCCRKLVSTLNKCMGSGSTSVSNGLSAPPAIEGHPAPLGGGGHRIFCAPRPAPLSRAGPPPARPSLRAVRGIDSDDRSLSESLQGRVWGPGGSRGPCGRARRFAPTIREPRGREPRHTARRVVLRRGTAPFYAVTRFSAEEDVGASSTRRSPSRHVRGRGADERAGPLRGRAGSVHARVRTIQTARYFLFT